MKDPDLLILSMNVYGVPGTCSYFRLKQICSLPSTLCRLPDVICLQEVHTWGLWRLACHELGRLGYRCRIAGPGRFGPAAGLAVFSRAPIKQIAFIPFRRVTRQAGVRGGIHKGVQGVQVEGTNVVVLNAHLSPVGLNIPYSSSRMFRRRQAAQLATIAALIQIYRSLGRAVILAGDLNLRRPAAGINGWPPGAADPFRRDTTPTYRGIWGDAFAVDYLMGWGAGTVRAAVMPTPFCSLMGRDGLSDHRPLWAYFIFS